MEESNNFDALSLDNILDDNDVQWLDETFDDQSPSVDTEDEDIEDTTEVDSEEEEPESVSSSTERNKDKGDTRQGSVSSSPNFYSSIAETFANEGILPDLDEETIASIQTPQDLRNAIDEYIKSEMGAQNRRIIEALNNGGEGSVIKSYESVIAQLQNIDKEFVKQETDESEQLRRQLIYQDFINRGFTPDRATKEVNKAISNGSDVDDALEALDSILDYNVKRYTDYLNALKAQSQQEAAAREAEAKEVTETVLNPDYKFFGQLNVDKRTRQRILENMTKPVERDKKGNTYTAIQKYGREHPKECQIAIATLFTLTDGFKTLDKLVSSEVNKKVKKGFKDLENRINNTARDAFGNLKYSSGVSDNGIIGDGFTLAL